MKYIKLVGLSLGIVILSTIAFVGMANAQSIQAGDKITVPTNETIDSMLLAAGNNIDIAGDVNGDVYCAGQNITISGTISGDVFCAGQNITIDGVIEGSVRLMGQSVTISGFVTGSATIGGQTLFIEKGSVISRDLLGGTQNITINGEVGRDSVIGANSLIINGEVGRNIKGGVDTLTIGSTGLVGGNLDYTSPHDPNINNGGEVVGTITIYEPSIDSRAGSQSAAIMTFTSFLYFAVAMITIGLVLVLAFPRVFDDAALKAIKKPGKTALAGIVSVFVAPILIIMLFASVFGIPLAIVILLAWILTMLLSAPFVGYMIAKLALKNTTQQPILIMLVGISLISIVYFIPIIGLIAMLSVYVFGTGMILIQSRQLTDRPVIKKTSK